MSIVSNWRHFSDWLISSLSICAYSLKYLGDKQYLVNLIIVIFNWSASAATFSRFIPTIKARFDYGAMIFILTFSLVALTGYRVDELLDMGLQRIFTILIGTSICLITSITICPVWAGQELHLSISANMDKLANSLDGQSSLI